MAYLPKSKYQIKETSGDEFIDPRTGLDYVGPYVSTNEGNFAGKNPLRSTVLLLLKSRSAKRKKGKVNNIYETNKTPEYAFANRGIVDFIKNTQPLVHTKSIPTEKDRQRGYYTRYFAKRNNSLVDYYEIDKQTYNLISNKQKTYDYNLYSAERFRWAIDGDILNVNKNTLLLPYTFKKTYGGCISSFSKT